MKWKGSEILSGLWFVGWRLTAFGCFGALMILTLTKCDLPGVEGEQEPEVQHGLCVVTSDGAEGRCEYCHDGEDPCTDDAHCDGDLRCAPWKCCAIAIYNKAGSTTGWIDPGCSQEIKEMYGHLHRGTVSCATSIRELTEDACVDSAECIRLW